VTERQDRERFNELASVLVKELQMLGYHCHFDGPYSAAFSTMSSGRKKMLKFGCRGSRWWVELQISGPSWYLDFEELRKDIMSFVRDER